MSFLEDVMDQVLSQELAQEGQGAAQYASQVEVGDDGVVWVRLLKDGVAQPGAMEFSYDGVIIDDEFDERLAMPFAALGAWWRRLHDYLSRFPAEAVRGDERVTFSLRTSAIGAAWSHEGLRANVLQLCYQGDDLQVVKEADLLVLKASALFAADFAERLAAFDVRRAAWAGRLNELEPGDVCLEEELVPQDEGWADFAAGLGLSSGMLADRVVAGIAEVLDRHAEVSARYERLYGLRLPVGVSQLAALVAAVGELPAVPSDGWEKDAPLGVARGRTWLQRALGMRPSGLCEWFAPGGLTRGIREAPALPGLPAQPGPLDARLDMRYRCDAPQFVTFLSGDSDGLHWGLWYDSPEHFPVIAHNYARDSAETVLDGTGDMLVFLRRRLETGVEEARYEWTTGADEELRGYALGAWRALRVVEVHLVALEEVVRTRAVAEEPRCPWPRTAVCPVGSPALALPLHAGQIDRTTPGVTHEHAPTVDQIDRGLAQARQDLSAGRPATALAFGLYLHWLDTSERRAQAFQLLHDAYLALEFHAFAEILKVHHAYRDLPSVGVFVSD